MVRLVGRGKMGMVAVITGIWLHQRRRIGGRWPCGHRGGQGRCPWGRMGPGRHAGCVLGYHDRTDSVRQETHIESLLWGEPGCPRLARAERALSSNLRPYFFCSGSCV